MEEKLKDLKKRFEEFLEISVLNISGLGLVCSVVYLVFSTEVLTALAKLDGFLPFFNKSELEPSLWAMIVLMDFWTFVALGLSVCIGGVSDTRLNREALRNCFNS